MPEPTLEEIKEEIERDVNRQIEFRRELEHLINRYSMENGSNTPDFMLAEYLIGCLKNFDLIVNKRTQWYRNEDEMSSEEERLWKKLNFAVRSIINAALCSNPQKASEIRMSVVLDNLDMVDETTKRLIGL